MSGRGRSRPWSWSAKARTQRILSQAASRIRRRDIRAVVDEVFSSAARGAEVETIDYVATTGEGEDFPFATGHFYGMTTHARGGLFLEPEARAVLDVGALHSRAVLMNGQGERSSRTR